MPAVPSSVANTVAYTDLSLCNLMQFTTYTQLNRHIERKLKKVWYPYLRVIHYVNAGDNYTDRNCFLVVETGQKRLEHVT